MMINEQWIREIWNKPVVDYLKVLSQHFPGGTEGTHKKLSGLRAEI
jgi:hypothetical protein